MASGTPMEGPLSKWTNMVHGWQYRWFRLLDDSLIYFTSREKMIKGQQRGSMRLVGAIVGIDGENNTLFTVSVEGKIFHLQGRDERERNQWVRALENAIRGCGGYKKNNLKTKETTIDGIKAKILEADQHLNNIILQVKGLESLKAQASEKDRKNIEDLISSSNQLLNTVKHAIILLQMARNKIDIPEEIRKEDKENQAFSASNLSSHAPPKSLQTDTDSPHATTSRDEQHCAEQDATPLGPTPISYSSDDDEFYDADEDLLDLDNVNENGQDGNETIPPPKVVSFEEEENFDFGDADEDFDEIYDNAEEHDIGNVQQEHGSVLVHLLSQVSVGMDLTKVTLPTFILERRSLLEMYADFFAHPEAFVSTVDLDTPEKRFISVVRYYLNAFYAARKSGVAKKPYNPILGETFRCRYNVPGLPLSGKKVEDGPFPGADENQLTFLAEQVSHHPPVSAFYAEHPGKRVSFNAHIYTKSSFLGLSIGVANIGSGTVTLHDYDEQYTVTFPSGYGRSIMSTPWVELGGKVNIVCEETGYYADIEFLTKPFFGGKAHKVQGFVYRKGNKKPVLTIKGEWNGVMTAKPANGEEYVFIDVKAEKEMKKECEPVMQQGERESRRLWRHVTAALLRNRINIATTAKRMIEQRQRAEAKERLEKGEKWNTLYFTLGADDRWKYDKPLQGRL
ncbi:unnamed protein product [Auanema sp. JU1783]|nr:unnamed protein product [Auanema sp. JU1783]